MKIKANNKKGYEEFMVGGVLDILYPNSKTRRGRVQGHGMISGTLTAENSGIVRVEETEMAKYRIRKLTPTECFRLMDVSDEDSTKILDTVSNSQAYKQAGNSICVGVLVAMYRQLGIVGVEKWNKE